MADTAMRLLFPTPCSAGHTIQHAPNSVPRHGSVAAATAPRSSGSVAWFRRDYSPSTTGWKTPWEVHDGTLDPKVASAMAALSRAMVSVLAAGELEERVRQLEQAAEQALERRRA